MPAGRTASLSLAGLSGIKRMPSCRDADKRYLSKNPGVRTWYRSDLRALRADLSLNAVPRTDVRLGEQARAFFRQGQSGLRDPWPIHLL